MVHADGTGADGAERSPKQFEFGNWYPIETAPRDGTRIRTVCGERSWVMNGYAFTSRWIDGEWHGNFGSKDAEIWAPYSPGPTHWMPLPPPPSPVDRSNDSESDADSLKQITSSESNSND